MPKSTIEISGSSPVNLLERKRKIKFFAETLKDDELDKLYEIAQSEKARRAFVTKFAMIKAFI